MSPARGEPGVGRAAGLLERDITELRDGLGAMVDELDRRRREAMDLRLQLRRHPVAAAVAGGVVVVAVGGAVALLVRGARRRQRASYKARQLRIAFGRVMQHPERLGRGEPPPSEKILAALGSAAATLLVRRALERAVSRPGERAARETERAAREAGAGASADGHA